MPFRDSRAKVGDRDKHSDLEVSMMVDAAAVPQDFVNETTLAAFGGSTGVIVAVNLVVRRLTGFNHAVVPFVAAVLISYALATSKSTPNTFLGWLIPLLNACLLTCAVIGANDSLTSFVAERPAGRGRQQGRAPKKWFRRFFD
jgi:hypothetical protein